MKLSASRGVLGGERNFSKSSKFSCKFNRFRKKFWNQNVALRHVNIKQVQIPMPKWWIIHCIRKASKKENKTVCLPCLAFLTPSHTPLPPRIEFKPYMSSLTVKVSHVFSKVFSAGINCDSSFPMSQSSSPRSGMLREWCFKNSFKMFSSKVLSYVWILCSIVSLPRLTVPIPKIIVSVAGGFPNHPSSIPRSFVLVVGKSLPELSDQMLEAIFVQK